MWSPCHVPGHILASKNPPTGEYPNLYLQMRKLELRGLEDSPEHGGWPEIPGYSPVKSPEGFEGMKLGA